MGAIPESEGVRQRAQKQLCSAVTFLHYRGVEIERYTRYNRVFTIVLIRPPASGDHPARLQVARAASEQALGLLRTCDVVAMFDSSASVVALLPETDAAGARTVFHRFEEQLVPSGADWILKLAAYPEHSASVEYFLDRFSKFLKNSDPETDPSEMARTVVACDIRRVE